MSELQAKVYLALLELDQAPVSTIAKKAEIKRPTCYLVLDELVGLKLVDKVPIAGKQFYKAKPAISLAVNLEEKLALANNLVPMLVALSATDTLAPKIKLYEGRSGVNQLYSGFFKRSEKLKYKDVAWFASFEQLETSFPGLIEKFQRMYVKKKIRKRELVKVGEKSRGFIQKMTDELNEFRVVDANLPINIDVGITQNEVVIFSQQAPLFGLSIEHKTIAQSFQAFFELAWLGAKK